MVALVLDGLVGFPAGLSPTSFHLSPSSPTSFHLSPTFAPNSLLLRGSQFFLKMCHCWCPPISTGHVAFLIIHLSPRSVTAGVRPFPLAMQHFYSRVSQVCHWWCPPFSAGRVAFLFICLPGLSLPVSGLFRRQCSISIHLSPRSVTAGVRPFPSAMQRFYSLVSQVCRCWCPSFSAGDATFLFICFPALSLLVSALFRWPCSMSIHVFPGSVTGAAALSAGHVAFLFICLPCDFFLFVFQVWCLHCCFLPCRLEQVHLLRDCLRDCIPATLCNTQLCFPFRASVG